MAPLWCDLGFFLNSRGNKAAANLLPMGLNLHPVLVTGSLWFIALRVQVVVPKPLIDLQQYLHNVNSMIFCTMFEGFNVSNVMLCRSLHGKFNIEYNLNTVCCQ